MQANLGSFQTKVHTMHTDLRSWHSSNFGEMETQLQWCKKVILFFDKIEEKRKLAGHEFRLRNKTQERAFMLANFLEMRWKQCSRCRWLQCGDRNTRFFHTYASTRLRGNTVSQLIHNGERLCEDLQIRNAFHDKMIALLGTEEPVMHFDPTQLYNPNTNLAHLQHDFTNEEIELAVNQLAKNRASGPDGLPNEFLQMY